MEKRRSSHRRRSLLAVLLTVPLLTAAAPRHGPTIHVACGDEHAIWVVPTSGTQYGSWTHNYVRNRSIAGCTGADNTWSTAHFRSPSDFTDQVEVGWAENYNGLGQKYWEIFYEGQNGGVNCGAYSYFISSGRWDDFRVFQHASGSTTFDTQVNYGSGWVSIGSCAEGFTSGQAAAETGERNASGATDHHTALQYMTSSRSWASWPGNTVGNGSIPNYHYCHMTATEYEILGSGSSCP